MRRLLALILLLAACGRTPRATPPIKPAPPTRDVRWNELDCRSGWVELASLATEKVSLDGYALGDGSRVLMVLPHIELAPGAVAAVDAPHLASACLTGRVQLLAPGGEVLDVLAPPPLPATSTWGRLPDGRGSARGMPPTRGLPNRAADAAPLTLNEVGCRGTLYLELSASPGADVSGSAIAVDGKRLVLPDGTLADGAGLVRIDPGPLGFPFYLGCSGHTVTVLDRFGAERDRLALTGAAPGASLGRLPDGTGAFTDTRPTPGAPNAAWLDESDSLFGDGVAQVEITLGDEGVAALSAGFAGGAPATVTWTDASGSSPADSEVRIDGSWYGTLRPLSAKAPFEVDFRTIDPGASLRGLPHLSLDNLMSDPSLLRVWLSSRLLRSLGFPAPRAGFAWVTVNGEDRGLYLATEPPDENMVARGQRDVSQVYQSVSSTDLGPDGDTRMGYVSGDGDRRALTALVEALARPTGFEAGVAPLLYEDEVLSAIAAAQVMGDGGDYAIGRSNYLLTLDPAGSVSLFSLPDTSAFGYRAAVYQGPGLLLSSCLSDFGCRARYLRIVGHFLAAVDFPSLATTFAAERALIQPYVDKDDKKEHDPDRIRRSQDDVAGFLDARPGDIQPDLDCEADPARDRDGDRNQCWFDCDESDPMTHRFAAEICGDGIDQDCNGLVDDGSDCEVCPKVVRGTHHYALCRIADTWSNAGDRCETLGMNLPVLDTQGEADWVQARAGRYMGQSYWLGLSDGAKEGTFAWVDGTPVTYTTWEQGEPNDYGGSEDCAGVYSWDGHWNDFNCGSYLGVACEEKCTPGTDADGDGYDGCGVDCDDSNPAVHPGAAEICGDGIDQDCDGVPDNGCP